MADRVLVFDFDGTCTVPVAGADQCYLDAYMEGFARLANRSFAWITEQFKAARIMIAASPDAYGWEINGRIVAPALVDAFVEAQVCAQIVLKWMGQSVGSWEERLEQLYQANYLKHQTTFRDELLETLRSLRTRSIPFYIVSNSDPYKVLVRLDELKKDKAWISLICGNAKKYEVTPGPAVVPKQMFFPGLERPVELRKQHYFDLLVQIMDKHKVTWDQLTVIGDIAELDLAMPVIMGARGCLILGPNTPTYERQWAKEHSRVTAITDLIQAV